MSGMRNTYSTAAADGDHGVSCQILDRVLYAGSR